MYIVCLFYLKQSFYSFSYDRSWCLICDGVPKPSCQGRHTFVDRMDKTIFLDMKNCLAEMSTEVSNGYNESVAKREQTQEHLRVKLEAIKSLMTRNSDCIQKLRSKIAKGAENQYLTPTDIPVSFSSIFKDLGKTVKEAKEEAEEADKLLNQVATGSGIAVKFYLFKNSFCM